MLRKLWKAITFPVVQLNISNFSSRLLTFIFRIMTREEKIKAIYKEMANKELTPWCCVEVKAQNEYGDFTYRLSRWDERPTSEIKEIIGHPVMIGTIFEWYSKKRGYINSQFVMNLIEVWTWYDKSIEFQSDYCVDFVHSLIKKS